MRLIIFFILITLGVRAQQDTLFLNNSQVVPCKITAINPHKIFYLDAQATGRFSNLEDVNYYSENGVRKTGAANSRFHNSSQRIDSVNVSDELAYMRNCMSRFHIQYNTGMSISLIGGALTGTSFFLKGDEKVPQIVGLTGLVMMIIGTATTIDAHKWFGKAGWGVSGKGNMVQVRYRFK